MPHFKCESLDLKFSSRLLIDARLNRVESLVLTAASIELIVCPVDALPVSCARPDSIFLPNNNLPDLDAWKQRKTLRGSTKQIEWQKLLNWVKLLRTFLGAWSCSWKVRLRNGDLATLCLAFYTGSAALQMVIARSNEPPSFMADGCKPISRVICSQFRMDPR